MRIESITLAGFRCFGPDAITVPIAAEITAVVGPNAAGKTALLHALAKLFGVARAERTVQRSDFHLGADDDPDEILVVGEKKSKKRERRIEVGRDQLDRCSSVVFDKPGKRLTLSCL